MKPSDLIAAAKCIDDESAATIISNLLSPDKFTRDQMKEVCTSALGYDPITFYDKKDITSILSEFMATSTNRKVIESNKHRIITAAMKHFEETRTETEYSALTYALHDISDEVATEFDEFTATKYVSFDDEAEPDEETDSVDEPEDEIGPDEEITFEELDTEDEEE